MGLAGFIAQVGVLAALAAAGVPSAAATALAVEAAVLHNFAWHEWWTWRDRVSGREGRLGRLVRFNAVTGLVSIAGNVALTLLYTATLHVPLVPANVLAVATLSLVTFCVADRWVFPASGYSTPPPPPPL